MAPEALNNEEPGPSFDLWSLAVLLFEALAGVNPYRGETIIETLARIERRAQPDLGRLLPGEHSRSGRFLRCGARAGPARQARHGA